MLLQQRRPSPEAGKAEDRAEVKNAASAAPVPHPRFLPALADRLYPAGQTKRLRGR